MKAFAIFVNCLLMIFLAFVFDLALKSILPLTGNLIGRDPMVPDSRGPLLFEVYYNFFSPKSWLSFIIIGSSVLAAHLVLGYLRKEIPIWSIMFLISFNLIGVIYVVPTVTSFSLCLQAIAPKH